MITQNAWLVVEADELALFVELQLEVVRQFDVISMALLVDFHDCGTSVVGFHIVGDGYGNELGGNGAEAAVYFVPCALRISPPRG